MKGLTIGVVFLFTGIVFTPTIGFTVVRASSENELVEVTTHPYGITEIKPHTIKLTQQQYHDIEALFDVTNVCLNHASTNEEVISIFNQEIAILNNYGLFGDVTVEESQRQITGQYQKISHFKQLGKLLTKNGFDWYNVCCLFNAEIETTVYPPHLLSVPMIVFLYFFYLDLLDLIGGGKNADFFINPVLIFKDNSFKFNNFVYDESESPFSFNSFGLKGLANGHKINDGGLFVIGFTGIIMTSPISSPKLIGFTFLLI